MERTSSRSHGRPRGRQAPPPRTTPPHLDRERLAERVREEQCRVREQQRIIEEAKRRGREDRGTRRLDRAPMAAARGAEGRK